MPPVAPIPGDPAALEAGAQVYAAAAEAWQALGAEVSTVAFGLAGTPDWSGEAADAFNAAARRLVEAAERGSAAMRDGAGALRAYAVALEAAQGAYAQASAEQAVAEAERAAARQAVQDVPADALLPPPLLGRLDMADVGVAAAARAVTAAVEQAQRAAREAAAAFREVAAQAGPVAELGAPGEGQDGGGVLGWLYRAGLWVGEQQGGFIRGFGEGVVGLGQGLWTVAKLTLLYYAFDPEGTRQVITDFGSAIQFAIDHPAEFGQAVVNWEDLEGGRYGEWLGGFAPDAILAGLTAGGGAGVVASTRSLRVVDKLTDVAQAANPLPFRHTLKDINPGFRPWDPDDPRSINCSKCVIALDESLGGRPSAALPDVGMSTPELARYFDSKFEVVGDSPMRAMYNIENQLHEAGPGARGIVFGSRGSLKAGHVFNAINDDGLVRFLDGQTGRSARFFDQNFQWFEFMRTN